jgi:meiotically up-regulated gene 157 (Mug157) protein
MRFAWSRHNPGYVPGRYGGLGSRHTPGVWPLGDAQEWLVSSLTGDHERGASTLAKLSVVASDDGMLPETYDPDTGDWWARQWFAWPGSLVGLLQFTLRYRTGPWA